MRNMAKATIALRVWYRATSASAPRGKANSGSMAISTPTATAAPRPPLKRR